MKRYLLITSTIWVLFVSCTNNDRIILSSERAINPILNIEVIEIPSVGKVVWIDGKAEIKKRNLNEYNKLTINTTINEDDILWLKKDTIVKIQFKDGSHIANKPVAKELFFTFESIKVHDMSK